jgi:hypothetical protein
LSKDAEKMFKWLERADSENDHLQVTLSMTANDSILGCCINVFVTYQHLAHVNDLRGGPKPVLHWWAPACGHMIARVTQFEVWTGDLRKGILRVGKDFQQVRRV